jgi:hypothetical protein
VQWDDPDQNAYIRDPRRLEKIMAKEALRTDLSFSTKGLKQCAGGEEGIRTLDTALDRITV